MSLGSSLSGITFSGIGSGIDTESMISRLMLLEQIPIQRLQQSRQTLEVQKSAMSAFRERVMAIKTAASALTGAGAFNPISATSSNTATATISASTTASVGTYNLAVSKLAQSHKISSSAQTDTTTALNQTGTMMLNGRAVQVVAEDTLTTIAQKINAAQAGVTASLINGGTGQSFLTLTSSTSGVNGKVQISDLSGTLATTLGLTSGVAAVRSPITNGFASSTFSSSDTDIGTMLGVTGLGDTTITLNGTDITVNLQTQSLQEVANTITASAAGVTATVKSVTENGSTRYQLELVGNAGTPTYADPNGTLEALGFLQKGYASQLVTAQDAEYTLDGMGFTSSTNSITTVIPGVTLTLLKGNATTPETSTLTLAQDNSSVKAKLQDFMTAFNTLVDFVKVNSEFDQETFEGGVLFGNSAVQTVESSLAQTMFNTVQGLTTTYSNIAQLGFTFDTDSKLVLNESQLDAALASSPTAVANVFRDTGSSTAEGLSYVSSTSKTKVTGAGSYLVNITQIATKGYHTAAVAQTSSSTASETLTFNGALFGNTDYVLTVPSGSSLSSTINQINNDSRLKDIVVATNDAGKLKIESKRFGTNGNFTVWSNLAAAADNSGIGTSGGEIGNPVHYTGLDVAGTINGETATGSGQFLTGNVGNATTEGLQIMFSGTALGNAGSIKFSRGVASGILDQVNSMTDITTGFLTANDNAIQDQIDDIDESIKGLQSRLSLKEQSLRKRFAVMEESIARFQQQASQISSITSLSSR